MISGSDGLMLFSGFIGKKQLHEGEQLQMPFQIL